MKIINKVLSKRLKNVLPFLISSRQMAYLKNRFIRESSTMVWDILQIGKKLSLEGFVVTLYFSHSHSHIWFCRSLLLIVNSSKIGFSIDFVIWIKTI